MLSLSSCQKASGSINNIFLRQKVTFAAMNQYLQNMFFKSQRISPFQNLLVGYFFSLPSSNILITLCLYFLCLPSFLGNNIHCCSHHYGNRYAHRVIAFGIINLLHIFSSCFLYRCLLIMRKYKLTSCRGAHQPNYFLHSQIIYVSKFALY